MLRFPDSTPFLDLERGLSGAAPVEHAEIALDFAPIHPGDGRSGDFGTVRGGVVLDGSRLSLDGRAFSMAGTGPLVWPRVRASLDLGDGRRLSLVAGLDGASAGGFVCRDGRHAPVTGATVRLGADGDPFRGLRLDVEIDGDARLELRPEPFHRLPVVRGGAPTPVRLVYACCALRPGGPLAGWCEVGGF
jgi:hypothetical protein